VHPNPHNQIVGIDLGMLDEHVEVAVAVEDPGVEQLELGCFAATAAVFFDQQRVRILLLRILVEVPHVGVRRRAVQIEEILLHILAVVAFLSGKAEHPFLQDRFALVPERHREADNR
jgi:hypothetical protein